MTDDRSRIQPWQPDTLELYSCRDARARLVTPPRHYGGRQRILEMAYAEAALGESVLIVGPHLSVWVCWPRRVEQYEVRPFLDPPRGR